jgi:hypothetical protein
LVELNDLLFLFRADWMQEARVRWLDEVRSELSKIAPEEEFDAVMAAGTIQYMVRSHFNPGGKNETK